MNKNAYSDFQFDPSVPGRNLRTKTQRFALYFGNRGFFPEKLMAEARRELPEAIRKAGYESVMMSEEATRYGAVESTDEGRMYAKWLAEQEGLDGVILCLPNFGDETGAVAALEEAGIPIWIIAYPDEKNAMGFQDRRDAFCGKFSVMDVFEQYKIPYTSQPPHVLHPNDPRFTDQLEYFAAVCRVVRAGRKFTIGAIGARTTAFKTVRYDELTLQKFGVTVETLDLSDIIARVRAYDANSAAYKERMAELKELTDMSNVPDEPMSNMVKMALVLDSLIEEFRMDAIAIRCWLEMEEQLNIAPCSILSYLNDHGLAAACELDVANALVMHALKAAAGKPSTVLDWNNNWGDEEDKCILFHCGPVPASLMTTKGYVVDHPMFAKALGAGHGWGPNQGRIAPMPFTFASAKTDEGKIVIYGGQGRFTDDEIQEGFFGCGAVAEIEDLQEKLDTIGKNGYRHHVSVAPGHIYGALREGLERYLGYSWTEI